MSLTALSRPLDLLDRFARLQLTIAACAVLAILLAISLDVVLRTTLSAPLTGTMEVVSFYFMIPVVFLPIMILEVRGEHIDTNLFYQFFPVAIKRLSVVVSGVLSLGIYGLLTYITFEQAVSSTTRSEVAMGVNLMPVWPVRWILPLAFASSAIAAFTVTLKTLIGTKNDD